MTSIHTHTSYRRPRFAGLVGAAAAAIAITATALSGSPATVGEPTAQIAPVPLAVRVLPSSVFPHFITTSTPAVIHSARAWAGTVERSPTPTREATRLRWLGFIGGVDEQMHGRFPLAAEAISIVEQYRSAAGAQAELAYQRASNLTSLRASGQKVTLLHQIMVPGAFGWLATGAQFTGINVMFASGPYFYLVGSGAAPATHGAPSSRDVITAAQTEYLLVHGCVAPAPAAHVRHARSVASLPISRPPVH
jgi:hypothetical protein